MLREELIRIFLKCRFIFVLFTAIILETVLFVHTAQDAVNLDADSLTVFQSLIHSYGGALTDEKETAIELIRIEREEAETKKHLLQEAYTSGELSYEEYKKQIAPVRDALRGTDGYNRFIQLYEEAITENSFLADTSVWELLLAADRFDPIYVITIILFCFVVGVIDEEAGANRLFVTTAGGKKSLQLLRLFVVGVFTIFLSILIFGGKIALAAQWFNLCDFSFPLYITEMFHYSQSGLTLFEGFVFLHIVRILGGLLLAFSVLLFGELTRSSLYTIFLSMTVVFVPGYLLQESKIKYLLPFPSSLLTAGGYLGSSESCNFVLNEAGEMQIRVLPNSFLIAFFSLTGIFVMLIIAANYICWEKRSPT